MITDIVLISQNIFMTIFQYIAQKSLPLYFKPLGQQNNPLGLLRGVDWTDYIFFPIWLPHFEYICLGEKHE